MRIDVTLTFPSTDEKIAAECKSTSWCKSHAPRRMRSGGRYSGRFATTVDYVAKKAWIDRGDKADLIDNEGFEGRPPIRRALATRGAIEGHAVGGCCDLSTSTHHLVQRLGVEQGYNLARESGRDLEEGIACATAGLRRRFAARPGLARLLQTCRRAPPIRKSNRRGPHSPATRSTDRGGQQTQGERRAGSTVQLLCRQSE